VYLGMYLGMYLGVALGTHPRKHRHHIATAVSM
jgi:hypothetical protein